MELEKAMHTPGSGTFPLRCMGKLWNVSPQRAKQGSTVKGGVAAWFNPLASSYQVVPLASYS